MYCQVLAKLKVYWMWINKRIELKALIPGIVSQIGPQHYEYLKKIQADLKIAPAAEEKKEVKKDDEIPDLVATNFEDVSNKTS